jgi:chromosome segregation ATPase
MKQKYKTKMEGHSSKIEQTEDRISELEDEMATKGKTEELLIKQLNTCEKKMQEITDSIKRLNLRIMGIEEGEEGQAKGMHNIFNKNNKKFPKSKENNAHSGTGSPQNTEQI